MAKSKQSDEPKEEKELKAGDFTGEIIERDGTLHRRRIEALDKKGIVTKLGALEEVPADEIEKTVALGFIKNHAGFLILHQLFLVDGEEHWLPIPTIEL